MNPFNVTVLREPGYAVLRTEGYINNLGAERIEQEVEPLIEHGCKRFIINFARSPIINSMGFSILIGIIERMLEIEGILVFTNLTEVNAETMEIMGLTQYAHLLSTEEEARGFIAQAAPPGAPAG
jgi:anti-anti-sigma factor